MVAIRDTGRRLPAPCSPHGLRAPRSARRSRRVRRSRPGPSNDGAQFDCRPSNNRPWFSTATITAGSTRGNVRWNTARNGRRSRPGECHGTAAHTAEAGARVPVGHAAGIAEGGRVSRRPQQGRLAQIKASGCAHRDIGGFDREPRLFPTQAKEDRSTGATTDVGAGQRQRLVIIAGEGAAVLIEDEDARARPQARQCIGILAQGIGALQGSPTKAKPESGEGVLGIRQACRQSRRVARSALCAVCRGPRARSRAPRIHAWRGSATC